MENMHSSLDGCLFLLPISIHAFFKIILLKGIIKIIFLITIIPISWGWSTL